MIVRRAPLLVFVGAYLLAQAMLVAHPYVHDAYPGVGDGCVVCVAIASTTGTGQLAASVAAKQPPGTYFAVSLTSQTSRIVPSSYDCRAPPSL